MIALIESGDALAMVCADVSGRKNSYNYVYPAFTIREYDAIYMSGVTGTESDLRVVQDEYYQGDISVFYTFLAGGDTGYAGMAGAIRERYVASGLLSGLGDSRALPLYVTLLGAVENRKRFVGVPYDSFEVMTTYGQAETIVQSVYDRTGADIYARFMGWFNNGINHNIAASISLIGALGNKTSLQDLDRMMERLGGGLYPDVQFQITSYISNPGYSYYRDASRGLSRYTAIDAVRSRSRLRKGGTGWEQVSYINSPRAVPGHVDGFIQSYGKYGLSTLSLRDLGGYIASDHRKNHTIDRETAKNIAQEQISKIGAAYPGLLLDKANIYAFPYASHIVGAPDGADRFYIIDGEAPFYQMIVHGYIDYACQIINTNDTYDYDLTLLKMLEYGASPSYILTYEPSSQLKRTLAEQYYSTLYTDWIDVIEEQYGVLNTINNYVRTAVITGHIKHAQGVYETVYSNGVSVFVNYGEKDKNIDGITVPSRGYATRVLP